MIWSRRKYIGPKSVQQRLIILLVTIFIPLSLLLYFVYRISEQTLVNKVEEINRFRVEQTTSRVQDLFQRIFMATNLFINDKQLLGALEIKYPYDIRKNYIYLEAIERLQYAFFLNEKYAVVIQDHNGNMFESDTSRLGLRKYQLQEKVMNNINLNEVDIFHSYQWSTLSLTGAKGEPNRYLVFTRWLFNPESATKKGIVSIIIPISYVQNILESDEGHYIIQNENHETVYSSVPVDSRDHAESQERSKSYISMPLTPTGWTLSQWDGTDFLNKQLKVFNVVVLLTIAFILMIYIVIFTFVLRTNRNVFHQIRSLSKQLANNSPNLSISFQSDYHIVELSEMLRQLVHNLTTSRKNFEHASAEKRKLEMQMLQEQMNPHFLLNTLNTIRFIADSASQTKLSSLVLSLSFLLRQQLYREEAYWTMREEKEYLEKYTEIQNARFGEEYRVHVEFEPEIMERTILRMLLQPLVENCFEHAFAGRTSGCIRITAKTKFNGMEVTVMDDGNGVIKGQSSTSRKSIGLSNVRDRLLLHYGEASSFDLKSFPGTGTSVVVFIPQVTG